MCRPGNRGKWEGSGCFSRGEALGSALRRKKRLRRLREWAPELEQYGHCFASYFLRLLVLCFWGKRMEIWKGEIHFYVFFGNLFGLFTK